MQIHLILLALCWMYWIAIGVITLVSNDRITKLNYFCVWFLCVFLIFTEVVEYAN